MKASLKYLVMFAIGVILMVFAFKGQNWGALLNQIGQADYIWVVGSLFTCLLAHIIRALRWRMIIEPLGHGSPDPLTVCYAVMIGYMANVAFPRMGEISRCGVINKTNGIPIAKLIGTVIVERLVDLLLLCLVVALAIFLQFDILADFFYRNIFVKLQGQTGNLTLLVVGGLLFAGAVIALYWVMKKKKWGFRQRLINLLNDMKSGVLSVKNMQNKGLFILYSILIWVLYGMSTYLCFFALEATSGLGVLAALSVLVFSSIGMIVPVQGGIGAFHLMVSEGLLVYQIPKNDGLAYALLSHSSQTLLVIIVGALSLLPIMLQQKTNSTHEQTE